MIEISFGHKVNDIGIYYKKVLVIGKQKFLLFFSEQSLITLYQCEYSVITNEFAWKKKIWDSKKLVGF